MSAQGDKQRNRPEEDPSTRRTAEDEIMRGDRGAADRGVGRTGGGSSGGSGTAGGGIENEGTGSLLTNDAEHAEGAGWEHEPSGDDKADAAEESGSGSTQGGKAPGVSGRRGMTGGTEKEGEGHSGPIRSGHGREAPARTEQDRAADGDEDTNAREGYEDQGSSRDADGTQGQSSGSRPGYR